jgi:predicted ribosomally synthesized peptide with nif11-like leader
MSTAAAVAFLERVEQDEMFAAELESMRNDPALVLAKVHAGGYQATQEEISSAFIDRYGSELTPDQLRAVAAGLDFPEAVALGVAGAGVTVALISAAASAAA